MIYIGKKSFIYFNNFYNQKIIYTGIIFIVKKSFICRNNHLCWQTADSFKSSYTKIKNI